LLNRASRRYVNFFKARKTLKSFFHSIIELNKNYTSSEKSGLSRERIVLMNESAIFLRELEKGKKPSLKEIQELTQRIKTKI
jgi:hypothetical protein